MVVMGLELDEGLGPSGRRHGCLVCPKSLKFRNPRNDVRMCDRSADDIASRKANSLSSVQRVEEFYRLLNVKDFTGMEELCDPDVQVRDYNFLNPIIGRKEVISYFKYVAASLPEGAKINVKELTDGAAGDVGSILQVVDDRGQEISPGNRIVYHEITEAGINAAYIYTEPTFQPGDRIIPVFKALFGLISKLPEGTL